MGLKEGIKEGTEKIEVFEVSKYFKRSNCPSLFTIKLPIVCLGYI